MAIFKAVVHSEYAQIPNSTLQDESLTFEARGLLSMLLSMPPYWEVNKTWVISQSPAGKDKVNAIFKELTNAGYIRKSETQRSHGRFTSDDYFIFPTPERVNRSGLAVYGLAVSGESAPIKETDNKKTEIKETLSIGTPTGASCNSGPDWSTAPHDATHWQPEAKCWLKKTVGHWMAFTTSEIAGNSWVYTGEPGEVVARPAKTTSIGKPTTEKPKAGRPKTKSQKLADRVRGNPEQWPCLNCLDAELLDEWATLRIRKNASHSDRALNTIEHTLETLRTIHGIPPDQAIAEQLDSGWTTVKVDYFERRKNQQSSGVIVPTPNLTPFGGNW